MEDKNVIDTEIVTESKPTGGYKVENVVLIESTFKRSPSIDLKDFTISPEFNISHEAHETTPENKFGVTLTLDYKGKQNEVIICAAKITMLGVFEKTGAPPISEEDFKKINAPAIIYPFVREHLHNICLKAGIANVLLPTVNFKV
jgi:preprotein translocase subunit SecB